MTDIVDPATRSRMMSGIRGKDTQPEVWLRSQLHRAGFRFRLHAKELPGRPDLVLPKYGVAVFVHGCFWHGHAGCSCFRLPATRTEFWKTKIEANRKRDAKAVSKLLDDGWRIAEVWECEIRRLRRTDNAPAEIIHWIRGGSGNRQVIPAVATA